MIDFIKVEIPNNCKPSLLRNPRLEWSGRFNHTTGEVLDSEVTTSLSCLKLRIKGSYIELSGSLHKFHEGGFNYSDFDYEKLFTTVIEICEILQINPFKCPLRNVEFGVNIIPPIPTKCLIRQLIGHKTMTFTRMDSYGNKSLGKTVKHQQYQIKCYNKSKQFGLDKDVFRYEIKVKKMRHLEKIEIRMLSDLCDIEKLHLLGNDLESSVKDLILIDKNLNYSILKNNQKRLLEHWSNPTYFEDLHIMNKPKFNRERRRLWQIQIDYSNGNPLQPQLKKNISKKYAELIQIDNKRCTKLTALFNKKWGDDLHQINHSNSMLIQTSNNPKRVCKITGHDISDQKKGSKFLSANKIGYYPAHTLRNQDSNPRNNLRRKIFKMKNQGLLFPLFEILKLTPEQKKDLEYWKGTKYEILEKH